MHVNVASGYQQPNLGIGEVGGMSDDGGCVAVRTFNALGDDLRKPLDPREVP